MFDVDDRLKFEKENRLMDEVMADKAVNPSKHRLIDCTVCGRRHSTIRTHAEGEQ